MGSKLCVSTTFLFAFHFFVYLVMIIWMDADLKWIEWCKKEDRMLFIDALPDRTGSLGLSFMHQHAH